MEMPFDILNTRLGKIRDNGDIDFDNTSAALDIDVELQSKFLFVPFEELEAVEIEGDRDNYHAGSGPEHCMATGSENPEWLYNHGINALALWWHLKAKAEKEEAEQIEAAKIARRPEPGVYSLETGRTASLKSSTPMPYLVAVTADRRIIDLNKTGKHTDFTDVFDGLRDPASWTFTLIETGLGA